MKKVYNIALAILLLLSSYLTYRLIVLQSLPQELLINEKNYTDALNEDDLTELKKKMRRMADGRASLEIMKAAQTEGRTLVKLVQDLEHLIEAQRWRLELDSIKKGLKVMLAGVENLPNGFTRKTLSQYKIIDEIKSQALRDLASEHYGLPLAELESKLLQSITATQDRLDSIGSFGWSPPRYEIIGVNPGVIPEQVSDQMLFKPPYQILLHQKERVVVTLSKKYTMRTIAHDSPLAGGVMAVTLVGDDFDITALSDEEQGVTYDGYTQWEFELQAKRPGRLPLKVKSSIYVGSEKRDLPSYETTIQVMEVSVWQRIAGSAALR